MTTDEKRMAALASYLMEGEPCEDSLDCAEQSEALVANMRPAAHDDASIKVDGKQYVVLTDEEATERCKERIRESLWAFNVSFLAQYIPALRGTRVQNAWDKAVRELCEDATPLVEAMLGGELDEFCDDAIGADGRGHFLAGYDGDENEAEVEGTTYYIYREN